MNDINTKTEKQIEKQAKLRKVLKHVAMSVGCVIISIMFVFGISFVASVL